MILWSMWRSPGDFAQTKIYKNIKNTMYVLGFWDGSFFARISVVGKLVTSAFFCAGNRKGFMIFGSGTERVKVQSRNQNVHFLIIEIFKGWSISTFLWIILDVWTVSDQSLSCVRMSGFFRSYLVRSVLLTH